jgi:ParB/RepB/Spo0J family partition protein
MAPPKEKHSTRNNSESAAPAAIARIDGEYCDALPLDQICTWDENPRKVFNEGTLVDLVGSIQEQGVLQPIVVRLVEGAAKPYQIVVGERRFRASAIAGLTTIPAKIRVGLDDAGAMLQAVTENWQRDGISAMEEARSLEALLKTGHTQADLEKRLSIPQSTIANRLRLLKLPQAVQQQIAEGRLGASHAKALLRFEAFPEILVRMAALAIENGTAVRVLETGLPFREDLEREKLIRELDYGMKFPKETCATCPHGAYFQMPKGDWHGPYCLLPAEYNRKQEAGKAVEIAEAAARMEKARNEVGHVQERLAKLGISAVPKTVAAQGVPIEAQDVLKDLPDISTWEYGTYSRPDNSTPGCSEACPCRISARRGDRLETVCIDPGRLNKLRAAATRDKKKVLRDRFTADMATIVEEASLGAASHFAERVLGATIAESIGRISADFRRKVVFRMAVATPPLPRAAGGALSAAYADSSKLREALGTCSLPVLLRLAAELLATNELEQAHTNASSLTPIVDFLLDKKAVPPERPAEVTRIVVDPPIPRSEDTFDAVQGPEEEMRCECCGKPIPKLLLGFPFMTEEKAKNTEILRPTSGIVVIKREEMEHCYCLACAQDLRLCRVCGCTHEVPCEEDEEDEEAADTEYVGGTCCWIEEDLCSACFGVEGAIAIANSEIAAARGEMILPAVSESKAAAV